MNDRLYGLIPAAGMGTRARPYTARLPKSMLEINGVPNLQRNIQLMRDEMAIEDIVIVVGYRSEVIRDYFGDGSSLGVRLHYIENNDLDRGLAWSVFLGRQMIDGYFCVLLSDECYVASNHAELVRFPYQEHFATCGIKYVDNIELIKNNYSVCLKRQDGAHVATITKIIEKPAQPENQYLGCGTFVFSPELFKLLHHEFIEKQQDYVEFLTLLDQARQQGYSIAAFELTGHYVNINDRDSLHRANYYERTVNFSRFSKGLLVYSEGSEQDIVLTLHRYRQIGAFDRIYVVVPASNAIEPLLQNQDIHLIRCPAHVDGYGEKIKYALDRMETDIIVLTEADYAFPAHDVDKLFVYLREADMVAGTRTARQFMEKGVDLSTTVRLANVALAKFMELLWWNFEGRFSDVGCTFRAFWRTSYLKVADELRAPGPEFSAEMMVVFLKKRMRIFEIPVNYRSVSRSLNRRYRNRRTFVRFLRLMIARKLLG